MCKTVSDLPQGTLTAYMVRVLKTKTHLTFQGLMCERLYFLSTFQLRVILCFSVAESPDKIL